MGGSSSKSQFTDIVTQISAGDIDSSNHEFWDELWKTALPLQDMFEVITPDVVRHLIRERPENIRTIITQAVAQLYQVVETPYPIYFEQAVNCSRILTRFLPFLLESELKFIDDLLWRKRVISRLSSEEGQPHDTEPLAVVLVNTLFHLLFLPDFTIEDPQTEFTERDLNTIEFKSALMWSPGVGSVEKTVVSSSSFDCNRIDILRVMIAAFSDSLYQSADTYDSCASMWLEVATSVDAPYAELIFYSLINTVLGYDPVGWGLPYGNLVAVDTAKSVMESAIHALLILLDYGHPIRYTEEEAAADPALPSVYINDTEAQGFNVFRRFLGSIDAPDQLNFIFRGFVRLLNNCHQAESAYLPFSITRVGIEQELLILLWKCLEEMPAFMPYVLKSCDVNQLLVPLCYFMLDGRKDPSKVGLMYLCTFTVLKLSGERSFSVALNKPFQLQQLPIDIPVFTGCHADLLIIVLHKLIVSGSEKLSALYSCFLTIICNISPYCKSLSSVASIKLINLLQLFVSPKFLFAAESNHMYVSMILESLNNIIQYQYEGNAQMIYSIIRRKEIFDSISELTLPAALRDAHSMTQIGDNGGTSRSAAAALALAAAEDKSSHEAAAEEGDSIEPCADATPTELISTTSKLSNAASTAHADVKHSRSTSNSSSSSHFMPSDEWLQAMKDELPLTTIARLLKSLLPQIEERFGKKNDFNSDEKLVVEFLHSTTMVGLLPVPHPIVIRKYQPNRFTGLWFTAFQWGVIFTFNHLSTAMFDGKHVKLFIVQTM